MKNVADFYPLSPMQQGMLYHSLFAPESGVYVELLSCTLRGELNAPAFERAWQQVVDRHAVLRTAFMGEGLKEPVQVVQRRVELPLVRQDWRGLSPAEQAARLEAYREAERRRGFDLAQAPLLRLALMRTAADAHYFVWTYHHILLDGWSLPLLLGEVFARYDALRRGRELHLEPAPPFRDYIAWLKRRPQDGPAGAEALWRQTLRGFRAPTPLVVDRPPEPGSEEAARYEERETRLPAETTAALRALARQHGLTLNTLVQGAWALLLSRYCGEPDVLFGATVSGRPADLPGAEFMVGLFINTLPIRVRVPPGMRLLPWLQELQARQAALRQYEYSPLVQIQGWSEVPRGLPMFESILVYENYPQPVDTSAQAAGADALAVQEVHSVEQTNYPLTVVAGADRELVLKILYDCRRFEAATIGRMLGHLETLLAGFVTHLDRPLATAPLLTDAERRQILVEWNATAAGYPDRQCVHEWFEAQVERTPEAPAVVFEGETLTYRELNRRANQLAHYLRKLGVGPEVLVGLSVERSPAMVVGLLGVLKAGGAYLPLDPTYPPDRLAFMLEDSQAPILLTQAHLLDTFTHHASRSTLHAPRTICLDADWPAIARERTDNPASGALPENLAYVIYTSGSTGRPKGALLQHRGLCNLVNAQTRAFGVEAGSRVLQFAPFSFDASVSETFMALLTGATLYLARQETLALAPELFRLLQEAAITVVTLPPSVLKVLPDEAPGLPALRTLISAGEACPPQVVARWSAGRRFFNAYGPTEATVGPTLGLVDELTAGATHVPIGRPIANVQIYLLDAQLQPVPVGVPGELYVGGVGLARGYLHRPALTAERFIPNPFSAAASERLYRTGDLARHRPDGQIEFLGRTDHQVKVRGFRLELGEIETALVRHPAVRDAVVVAPKRGSGDRRLVAYVVPAQGGERAATEDEEPGTPSLAGELRAFLKETLPEYMVPSLYVELDALPLTPNGKVDRRALPAVDGARPALERPFVPPRDALELQLARIWEEVLDTRPIGVQDDFFALGGHSLLAVRLMAQIQQQFGQTLPLVTLIQETTVERLAAVLRQRPRDRAEPWSPLVALQPGGSRRPLFFVHPSGGSVHWYADLARGLGPDQPFYGLQARGLNGDQALHTRVEEMATFYVEALRAFQPEAPYLLGSWSMGVVVAFEMAQQLQAQGQEVALLAILDQGPTLPAAEPEDDAAYLVDVFGGHLRLSLDQLRQLDPEAQLAHVFAEARRVKWISPDITLAQFRHFVRMLRTHTEAWRSYRPRPYPGRITLFRAKKQPAADGQPPDLGWGRLAAGGVEIHQVPGDHLSMIHKPHARALAKELRACLDRVRVLS